MSLASEIGLVLEEDDELMAILTGGIFTEVEEVNRQLTPEAFDSYGEIQPCLLIKMGVETPTGPYLRSANTPLIFYFYQRQGYDSIDPAMGKVFDDLNETQSGDGVWNIQFSNAVYQQRDQSLDCALGTLRFNAIRQK